MTKKLYAAIDVGTTTVAVSIIDENNIVAIRDGFLNPEKKYGSDVISRISNSLKNDNLKAMQDLIINAIKESLITMLKRIGYDVSELDFSKYIERIVIAANTTMASIILGLSIGSLGKSPFKMPFDSDKEIFLFGIKCYVLAGASAFIGADVLGGAYSYCLKENESFMDLGTNGEMIVRSKEGYFATSSACGPAFENCTRAKGIYGSTTLSNISFLLKRKILNKDLILTKEQIRDGINCKGMVITADILRNIQLAVASVYASYSMLLKEAGLSIDMIERLYIAGGFGFNMSLMDAVELGIIPEKVKDKTCIIGNSSLKFAEEATFDTSKILGLNALRKGVNVINFGGNGEYQKLFEENLNFKRR